MRQSVIKPISLKVAIELAAAVAAGGMIRFTAHLTSDGEKCYLAHSGRKLTNHQLASVLIDLITQFPDITWGTTP